jgi:hypothetical protein
VTGAAALALVLIAAGTPPTPSLTGTWEWGSFEKGGGTLATLEEPEGTRFQLFLARGAPGYNTGSLEGRLTVKDGRATYLQVDGAYRCEITFAFARGSVVLKAIDEAGCPFGYQVHADGTYRRTSRKKPKFDLIPQ